MKILIDTDPGVDDAIALVFALAHPDLDVVAVTTVGGNSGLANTTANAAGILNLMGASELALIRGSENSAADLAEDVHGAGGLSGVQLDPGKIQAKDGAAQFIVDMLHRHPGEIRLVTLGPLTNIADALTIDPQISELAAGLSIMGGAIEGGNISAWAEFNIAHDAQAAAKVLEAGFNDLRICGLDATRNAVLTPVLRELCYQFGLAGNPIGTLIHDITRSYLNRYWQRDRVLGCRIHDLLPIALLVDPSISQAKPAKVSVQLTGEQYGRTVADFKACQDLETKPNALIYTNSTDNAKLMKLTFRTLFTQANETSRLEQILSEQFG